MRLRLILQSSDDGEREFVEFSEYFDSPAEDFLIEGCTIEADTVIEVVNWPLGFPLDYPLKRTGGND